MKNRDDRIADPQKRLLIFRSLAGTLHEKVQKVVWYPAFALVKILPPKDDVRKASSLLIGLSNSQVANPAELWEVYLPWATRNEINELLRLKLPAQKSQVAAKPKTRCAAGGLGRHPPRSMDAARIKTPVQSP